MAIGNLKPGHRKYQVLRYAILSRFIVWCISTIAILIIPCYDTSSTISVIPTTTSGVTKSTTNKSTLDAVAWSVFGQYSRWDAAYFLRISQVGYEYEKNHAFQPFLPILINVFRYCSGLSYFSSSDNSSNIMSIETSYLIAGVFVTNVSFILAAIALYDLSIIVLKNERLAYISSLLFCFNPASIFMSAIYTGSLYACLSFYGMLYFERTSLNDYNSSSIKISTIQYILQSIFAMIMFACACATRSNGLLLAMYPVYFVFKDIIWPLVLVHILKIRFDNNDDNHGNTLKVYKSVYLLKNILTSICAVSPYFIVQHYGYKLYCVNNENNEPKWCKNSNVYKHVQERYWGSGVIFGYWTVNQIPNFLLAFPVLFLSYSSFYLYLRDTRHQSKYSIGSIPVIRNRHDISNSSSSSSSTSSSSMLDQITSSLGLNHVVNIGRNLDLPFVGYLSHRVAPYVWHLFGLTSLIVVMAHVQISTRLLFASCPSIYWFLACNLIKKKGRDGFLGNRLFVDYYLNYSWLYFTLGCVLFSTFYPWT